MTWIRIRTRSRPASGRGAHMGWMVRDWPTSKIDFDQVKDLQKDPIVMWQHRQLLADGLAAEPGCAAGIRSDVRRYCRHDTAGRCLPPGVFPSIARFSSIPWRIPGASAITSDETLPATTAVIALLTWGEGYHNFQPCFPGRTIATACAGGNSIPASGLIAASSGSVWRTILKRTPKFKIQRARLQMQFPRAARTTGQCGRVRADLARNPWTGNTSSSKETVSSGRPSRRSASRPAPSRCATAGAKTELRTPLQGEHRITASKLLHPPPWPCCKQAAPVQRV